MSRTAMLVFAAGCIAVGAAACAPTAEVQTDVISDTFPQAQTEIHAIIETIGADAMNADAAALRAIHLVTPKFSKFGPRSFERQTVEQTNESETAFFTSISELELELKDIKIDVFGEVAIATYYPHYSFVRNGQKVEGMSRQTLVFLDTDQGWKIIHEHGTPRKRTPR